MTKFKLKRGDIIKIVTKLNESLDDFDTPSDAESLFMLLASLEAANNVTDKMLKAVDKKLRETPSNLITRDEGEFYTPEAAIKRNEQYIDILEKEVEFNLNGVLKNTTAKYPKTMSSVKYLLWNKFFID